MYDREKEQTSMNDREQNNRTLEKNRMNIFFSLLLLCFLRNNTKKKLFYVCRNILRNTYAI
jgi:hypothetical protein